MRDNWGRRGAGTIPGGRSQRPRCCPGQLGLWEDGMDQAGMRGWALGMGERGPLCSSCTDARAPHTIPAQVAPAHPGARAKGGLPCPGWSPRASFLRKAGEMPSSQHLRRFLHEGWAVPLQGVPSGPSLPSCLVSCKLPGMRMSEQQDGWKRRQCWQGLQGEFSQALVPKEILSQVPPAS